MRGDAMRSRKQEPKSNPHLQAAFLEVVENQLRDNNPPETKQTLDRLVAEGHSPEDAKLLIAQAVAVEVYTVLKRQVAFNPERFVRNLRALPEEPKE
jgi:hypothetical protein